MTDIGEQAQKQTMTGRPKRRRTKLQYRLRSFRAESGFPYDQYVWVYSRLYRFAMRRLHARGRHWHKRLPGGQLWCHWCGNRQLDADDDWTGDLAVVAPFVVMQRRAEQAEAEVRRLRTENDELHDDVLRVITQRNLVCERLAARIIPGPDGQDDIDRRRLIREVSEEAWDDVDGWQEMAAKGAAVIAERDRLRSELAETNEEVATWKKVADDILRDRDRLERELAEARGSVPAAKLRCTSCLPGVADLACPVHGVEAGWHEREGREPTADDIAAARRGARP